MILALDISTKTGWATSDGRSGVCDLTKFEDHANKALIFEKWLGKFSDATLWVIERPLGFGSRVYTVNGLVWTAHMTAKRLNIPRSEVQVNTWRKAVLGNGRAKKADAIRWAKERGHDPKTDDEAEALCILHWAQESMRKAA